MSDARMRLGRAAETHVADRLAGEGWQVINRNVYLPSGELDLVAVCGSVLVFVEVKAARAFRHFGPERASGAVDARKLRRLRRLALEWMDENGLPAGVSTIRIDVVGVTFDSDGLVSDYEHLEGVSS